MPAETRSLAWARVRARAPRIAALGTVGLLSLAGLRGAVVPPAAQHAARPNVSGAPATVAPFAEAFVRDYLTWTASDPVERERRLAAYLAEGLDGDAGLVPGGAESQRPLWTVAGAPRPAGGRGRWRVAVLAALPGGRRMTLLVTVSAGPAGSLTVCDYPSLGALAARGGAPATQYEDFISDEGLSAVVERALRNYLAGRAGDLQADLAPGARVTTPETTARLLAIDELAWQQPGRRAAVLATAQLPDRTRMRLRFDFSLRLDSGRWFVAAIDTPPPTTTQGAIR